MNRSYENSKYFKWGMNALLVVSFPAFLSFINWAINDEEANWVKALFLFSITCVPMVYSLFYNIKFLGQLLSKFQGRQANLWFLFALFLSAYVSFSSMFAFTEYIDHWYAYSFGITSVLGMFAMVRYIKSGKS